MHNTLMYMGGLYRQSNKIFSNNDPLILMTSHQNFLIYFRCFLNDSFFYEKID